MIGVKACLLFLLLVSLAASSKKPSDRRSLALRFLQDLNNAKSEEVDQTRRNHEDKAVENTDEINSNRRSHAHDVEEQYFELRTKPASTAANTGPVITLQNRALMNTRLRVLYTDENCTPFLAESGLLMTLQTKSVTLPNNAQHIKILVEKDMFAEHWRLAYNGTVTGASKCIRITGVTVSSPIKPCK